MERTFAISLHALLSRDDAAALVAGHSAAAEPRVVRDLTAAGVAPGDRVAFLYPRDDAADTYDILALTRLGPGWAMHRVGGPAVMEIESVRHRSRALAPAEVSRLDLLVTKRGSVGRMEPHVHRSPSDLRYRVHDGEKFVAVYEPNEQADAEAHLQKLLGGRRRAKRPTPVSAPADFTLDLDAVPTVGRGATTATESMDTVHIKQMSDGWRVWHPGVQAYVTGPGFTAYDSKTAAMARARDIIVEMKGKAKRAARGDVAVAPGVSSGALFSPAEMTAKGGQMGFKFNGRKRNAPQLPSGRRTGLAPAPSMPTYDDFPIGRAVSRDDLAQRRRRAVEEYEAMESLRVEHF